MELEQATIKCGKCGEQMQIFLPKVEKQLPGFSQVDVELKNKINEIIKSLGAISLELEDKEARLAKIEDFLSGPPPQR